ncbi:MAG: exonuclease domain-containing protein [Ruminococcaceae bacterium]|nr:exonuclease domain-containing protein [Oscillospiraceae bacterium]
MNYIVIDLEWNGSWSKKAHGYFNEIIEVGAVKVDEQMRVVDEFRAAIKPVVSKKLSTIVTDLTNITAEELEDGTTFTGMMRQLSKWMGKEPSTVLTWSTTDLLVLMENCRYFYGRQEIPFLKNYMDFQVYAQQRMGVDTAQQLGLARAGEMLEIPEDDMSLHRALDDSKLTAAILQKVYDKETFVPAILPVDNEFYKRITFKSTIIKDLDDPLIKRSELCFNCPDCGQNMKRKGSWRFRSRAFCAEFSCRRCQKKYTGRVQYKLKYEGVEIKKKLNEILPKTEEPAAETVPV